MLSKRSKYYVFWVCVCSLSYPACILLALYYTGWFMTCGHYCRMWFCRSSWSKKLISIWVIFSVVMDLWVLFHHHKHPPANCALQVTLYDLEPAGTETDGRSCISQLVLFTTEQQHELWLAVTFLKTCVSTCQCELKAVSWC